MTRGSRVAGAMVASLAMVMTMVLGTAPAQARAVPDLGKPGTPCTVDYLNDPSCTYQTRLGTFSVDPMIAVAGGSITGTWAPTCALVINRPSPAPCPFNWSSFLSVFSGWPHSSCAATDATCVVQIPRSAPTRRFSTVTGAITNDQGTGTARVYYAVLGSGFAAVQGTIRRDGQPAPGIIVRVGGRTATSDASGGYFAVLEAGPKVTVAPQAPGVCVAGSSPCQPSATVPATGSQRVDFTVGTATPTPTPTPTPTALSLDAINWAIMGDTFRAKAYVQLLKSWRAANPNATREQYMAAVQEVDLKVNGQGPTTAWMAPAWQAITSVPGDLADATRDALTYSALVAKLTADDVLDGTAQRAVLEFGAGAWQGGKRAVKGMVSLAYGAPEMTAFAIDFWSRQQPSDVVGIMAAAGIDMTREAAHAFLDEADRARTAALRGDKAGLAKVFGEWAGENLTYELLTAGIAAGAAPAARSSKATSTWGRAARTVEEAAVEAGPAVKRAARGSAPTELSVTQMQQKGYTPFEAQHVDAIAQDTKTWIGLAESQEEGAYLVQQGLALPKSEGIKAKTTRAGDAALGGPKGKSNLAAYYEPVKPANFDALAENDPLRALYQTRLDQWRDPKMQSMMAWLETPPGVRSPTPPGVVEANAERLGFRLENGVEKPIWIKREADGTIVDRVTGLPFGPDHDVIAVWDATTGKLASQSKAEEVMRRLHLAANPQHGPGTANWQPTTADGVKVRETVLNAHSPLNPNGTPLLVFKGDGSGLAKSTWLTTR